MHPMRSRRGEDGEGLKWSKVNCLMLKCECCTSIVFTCCVLGHRSFIIVVELLKYRSLSCTMHGSVFKPLITPQVSFYIHVADYSCWAIAAP